MKKEDKEIILDSSDEAATYRTDLSGWVSRDGFYFGDNKDSESMARYRGCTHCACKNCGNPTRKDHLLCDSCRRQKYWAMPAKEWDEKTPLYSDEFDRYFFDIESAEDWGASLKDMRLILCEPIEYRKIEDDYWEDCLPENGELPCEVKKAIEDLNKILETAGPASFAPGKFRLKL